MDLQSLTDEINRHYSEQFKIVKLDNLDRLLKKAESTGIPQTIINGDKIEFIKSSPCLLMPSTNLQYQLITCVDGKKRVLHRVLWAITKNNCILPDEDSVVRHLCGNSKCINVDHLYIGTHQLNMRDKMLMKNATGFKVLSDLQIIQVKEMIMAGYTTKEIMDFCKVGKKVVYDLKTGRTNKRIGIDIPREDLGTRKTVGKLSREMVFTILDELYLNGKKQSWIRQTYGLTEANVKKVSRGINYLKWFREWEYYNQMKVYDV